MEQYAPNHPPPESRLPMGVYGGVIFAVGFFWFGWTSFPSVSYWAPLLSGLAFGISLMFLFVSFLLTACLHVTNNGNLISNVSLPLPFSYHS